MAFGPSPTASRRYWNVVKPNRVMKAWRDYSPCWNKRIATLSSQGGQEETANKQSHVTKSLQGNVRVKLWYSFDKHSHLVGPMSRVYYLLQRINCSSFAWIKQVLYRQAGDTKEQSSDKNSRRHRHCRKKTWPCGLSSASLF